MDLEIYNKAKICKYLEFYKKNLSKKEYKKALKQFKLSLKLGNFSFAKTLLQERGFIFTDTVGVGSEISYDSTTETYTVTITPFSKIVNFYPAKKYDSSCTAKPITLTLQVAVITSEIKLTISDGKISSFISSYLKIEAFIFDCCHFGSYNLYTGGYLYDNDVPVIGSKSDDFFTPIYDENKNITRLETNKFYFDLCKDGGINCTGCEDCVYFLSRYKLAFTGDDHCKGHTEENNETGYIEYDSTDNHLRLSFPIMQIWAGGGDANSGKFQYVSDPIEVKET